MILAFDASMVSCREVILDVRKSYLPMSFNWAIASLVYSLHSSAGYVAEAFDFSEPTMVSWLPG